jgi:hypothetical protein
MTVDKERNEVELEDRKIERSCAVYTRGYFCLGKGDWDVKLITHLHPEQKLRMGGVMSPLPLCFLGLVQQ